MIGWIVAAYIAYALWLETSDGIGKTRLYIEAFFRPVTNRFKK